MAKLPKHVPRGSFGKGTELYKEAVNGLKQSMRKSMLVEARKTITEMINQKTSKIHSVKITDDQIIFLDDKYETIKAMKA